MAKKLRIPETWIDVILTDAVYIEDHLRKPINSAERQSRIEGKPISSLYPYYGATGQVGFIDSYLTDGEYVLIGEDGAPFFDPYRNKAYTIKGKTWVNNHAHILKANKFFDQKFLLYYLNQFDYKDYVSGTTRLKLTKGSLERFPLPLPPLNEQHRIVSKIEELFSELDHGVANLKKAQNQLKVYRQALLKQAFEGKLTEQWRKGNKPESAAKLLERIQAERENRYEQALKDWKAAVKAWEGAGKVGRKPGKPKGQKQVEIQFSEKELIELPELPSQWEWTRIEMLVYSLDQGWSPQCENYEAGKNQWGIIKTTAVQPNYFDAIRNKKLPDDLMPRKQHELQNGDILITRAGPRNRVGICCIVRNVRPKLLNCDKVYRIRAIGMIPEFIVYILNSSRFLKELEKTKSGISDSGLNLKQDIFLKIPVPTCSMEEQIHLVEILENEFSIIDNLENTIEAALQKSEALRQSILKQAFEGKLVPQDPNDEPASELLKRIQAEKAAYLSAQQQQKKRKTTKKTKSA